MKALCLFTVVIALTIFAGVISTIEAVDSQSSSFYISFSSILESNNKVQINCKSSIYQAHGLKGGAQVCTISPSYWMKHFVLESSSKESLAFVPGVNSIPIRNANKNQQWCWTCNFEWGSNIVKEFYIFSATPRIELDDYVGEIFFQVRSTGIYRRVTDSTNKPGGGQDDNDDEFDKYILIKEWSAKDDETSDESTEAPPEEFKCTEEGRFRDPEHCDVFHICESYDGGFLHHKFDCPETTVYCPVEDKCGWEYECPC